MPIPFRIPFASRFARPAAPAPSAAPVAMYVMRRWPTVPEHLECIALARTLGRLSCGAMTQAFLLAHCGLPRGRMQALLDAWVREGTVERTTMEAPCRPLASGAAGRTRAARPAAHVHPRFA